MKLPHRISKNLLACKTFKCFSLCFLKIITYKGGYRLWLNIDVISTTCRTAKAFGTSGGISIEFVAGDINGRTKPSRVNFLALLAMLITTTTIFLATASLYVDIINELAAVASSIPSMLDETLFIPGRTNLEKLPMHQSCFESETMPSFLELFTLMLPVGSVI